MFLTPKVLDPTTGAFYNAAMTSRDDRAQRRVRGNGPARRLIMACAMMIIFSCWLAACGSAKKPLSVQAQMASRVDTVIAELQTELGYCDRNRIAALLAPPLLNDEAFSHQLTDFCNRATDIHPDFVVERLWLQSADTVRVDLQWTLRAVLPQAAGPSPSADRPVGGATMVMGTAHFTLVGKETPRLTAITGDNPFAPQFDQALIP
jgi:hypothetical protein